MNETGVAIATPVFFSELKHFFAADSLKHIFDAAAKICFMSQKLPLKNALIYQ
ncbi:hypothetical protein QFZ77_001374 [Paenibacillus sp. V4I3]|uniref:hypothetical protein n=1 Tax=Paenibacillus sp. V4I3 TaxID=3042305 RepID=UPI00278540DE|nr:hypothetical protein [Paenibacillus sp. V4I3]MDQ0872715.1 hypothetical protein [Paenibacillus sp. V4I3]